MNINGTQWSLENMNFSEIGKLLQELSPEKDGTGLRVEFTEREEMRLEQFLGMRIFTFIIYEELKNAVRAVGKDPKLQFTYSNRVFETTVVM